MRSPRSSVWLSCRERHQAIRSRWIRPPVGTKSGLHSTNRREGPNGDTIWAFPDNGSAEGGETRNPLRKDTRLGGGDWGKGDAPPSCVRTLRRQANRLGFNVDATFSLSTLRAMALSVDSHHFGRVRTSSRCSSAISAAHHRKRGPPKSNPRSGWSRPRLRTPRLHHTEHARTTARLAGNWMNPHWRRVGSRPSSTARTIQARVFRDTGFSSRADAPRASARSSVRVSLNPVQMTIGRSGRTA